jgi:hypothetical protein
MGRMPLLILAAVTGAALAQGSGLKAGLWELTTLRHTVDGRDTTADLTAARSQMMQRAMANMAPEERKQMEAMMASRGASGPNVGGLRRFCVSPAMAASDKPIAQIQGPCPPSKVNRSGNTTTFEFNCKKNGVGSAGKGERTVAGDTITTRVDATVSEPRGRHTMHNETQIKYLGRDCQGIKPLDELGLESDDSDDTN